MTVTRNPSALTLADLNTTINHEPRIKDVRIGERLGMARPTNIRQTIEANMAELERYGSVHAARAVIEVGKGASREITAYHLNEPQTLLLCMLSRTERDDDWSGYLFRRPARAAYVDGPAANERSQIRVLGRVLSVEAL